MAREIDLCTCGKDRRLHEPQHGDGPVIDDHDFMPHPQPSTVRTAPDLRQQIDAFLVLYGSLTIVTQNLSLLTLPNGETWRFDIRKVS